MPDDWQVASEKAAPKAPPPGAWEVASEKSATPENYGFTAGHMAKQGWEGLKQLGSSLDEMAKDLVFPKGATEGDKLKYLANKYILDPADREEVLAKNAPDALTSIGHSIAQSIPLVGPWAASLGEQAGTGDVGGAAARGATQVAAIKAAPAILKGTKVAAGMAQDAIGESIHTPEGELTPGAKMAGKVGGGAAGAAAGSLVGHEYLGAAAGYKLGPSLLDRMFPEPDATAAARETFQNTKEIAESQEAALKEAERRANAERITTSRATKAAQDARDAALKARDQHAQDLMDRQAAQDKLDAADIRATNAAARAKRLGDANAAALEKEAQKAARDAQEARDQHAQDLMDRQKQQDVLDAKHAKALKTLEDARMKEITANARFKAQGGEPETPEEATPSNESDASSSQDLITRTKKIVKPGERPSTEDLKRAGDMTQVPLPRLQLLASWGDELAKNEINRRLRNK